jgi:hypothetical protein
MIRHLEVVRTHCTRGHELTEENVYMQPRDSGGFTRGCRTCRRRLAKERHARLAENRKGSLVRSTTSSIRNMSLRELERGRAEFPEDVDAGRPRTRAECAGGERPCPFVACRFHLYLDVSDIGTIKWNFPHLEVHQLTESCTLDVADREGTTLDEVGMLLNLTRERVRQIEVRARKKLFAEAGLEAFAEAVREP